ncbi:MAG TPA: choice-of-anchor D domain-containing protein [Terracidiphilus sp.]|nr:choice-of-anchor D domain-containing protein [Terracidiphilus sp.]
MRTLASIAASTSVASGQVRVQRRLRRRSVSVVFRLTLVLTAAALVPASSRMAVWAQAAPSAAQPAPVGRQAAIPPRVAAARRFLAERGWRPEQRLAMRRFSTRPQGTAPLAQAGGTAAGTATWQPLGPAAVLTPNYGLVTGRVAALALDPSDATGNHLFVGTTGGGVWAASNAAAADPSAIVFTPLTDAVGALSGAYDASISVGALTVQPGGTGVVLAGTGDPNDVLDSYYGAGILRSADGGATWTLIQETHDAEDGLGGQDFSFVGEGFAGFAWSTASPSTVVAAVSQAYEGTLVDADQSNLSYEGLYYSTDSGATWHLATITDGSGEDVQGPLDAFAEPDGNAATAVVWNPVRQVFVAAVRYHGYYSSPDGVTWTRLAAQPGAGLSAQLCPHNLGITGSIACSIFRGALAVNPVTGDTFAWTVDGNNQDQGLWQDECDLSGSACGNAAISFEQQWSTAALEASTLEGPATIADGNYNLALAAIPSEQDTLLLAGDNDLWKCSLAAGCAWRNTTNAATCMSAQVGPFQHALAWNAANPLEIFLGNDSGLWRSLDAIGETGQPCAPTDSAHFENLNGSLGSLAEVVSLSAVPNTPYAMMAGLGVNGTAGVKSATATADWPQILSGYGGPVAIDPNNSNNWYVNDQPGVAIYLCSQTAACTSSDFGTSPVVTDADVNLPEGEMPVPAPFLVDPLDSTQLLIGTCQLWRGPANGVGWSASNAVTPILDSGAINAQCSGDALIRSIFALPLAGGGEIIYLGMYGSADFGANLPGHVLSVLINPSSGAAPVVTDLTLNPVVNAEQTLNYYGLDISSVYADAHDATGNTVYVTVEGFATPGEDVQTVYQSTDGGAHWTDITANLPAAPANSVVVDPANAAVVYVATDQGVYFTADVSSCAQAPYVCWSPFGTGLPEAPAVALSAAPAGAPAQVLVAATYGRGIWQTPLWSAGTGLTTATATPASLTFSSQTAGTASAAQTVIVENTGAFALAPTSISVTGSFSEIDNCSGATVPVNSSCAIQVAFVPETTGAQSGQVVIDANVYGGQITVDLNGTATAAGVVSLSPDEVNFSPEAVGATSAPLAVAVANNSASAVSISGIAVTAPFVLAGNACGTVALAANADCQIQVEFAPTQAGPATGTLTLTDGSGTQTVELTGVGLTGPTDTLSATSLTFPTTATGQLSAAQPVTLTNSGGQPLESIAISASSGFTLTNGCTTQLGANASCTIQVQFAPTQIGSVSGTLTVTDALRAQTVSLSGTGAAPAAISVSPSSLTFLNQQPGVASAPQTVTVSNSGGVAMANVGAAITGPAAASYSIAGTTCGATLNAQGSCTIQIVFTPAGAGPIAATLAISSSTPGVTAVSVPLNGAGQLATGLTASPAQVAFPNPVGVGQASAAQTVTITNATGYSIASLTLAASAPFTLSANTCTGALAAGASCSAAVAFAPTVTGAASGALTITSSAVAATAAVALSGTGFNFTVASSGAGSLTVASGQTADFPLVISPSGAQIAFGFACGALPANASCSFNPSTETLNSGVQGNVTVEIATGEGTTAARNERWGALPLVCGLLLLPLALASRRKVFLAALLLVLLAGGVSSCTTSSGGTGGTPPDAQGSAHTPPGTYTIPVTITADGASQAIDLTLTVD